MVRNTLVSSNHQLQSSDSQTPSLTSEGDNLTHSPPVSPQSSGEFALTRRGSVSTSQKRELLTRAQRRSLLPALTTSVSEEGKQVIESIEDRVAREREKEREKESTSSQGSESPEVKPKDRLRRSSLRLLLDTGDKQESTKSPSKVRKANSITMFPTTQRGSRRKLDPYTRSQFLLECVHKEDLPPIIEEMPLVCFGHKLLFDPTPKLHQSLTFNITFKEDFYSDLSHQYHFNFAATDTSKPSSPPFIIAVSAEVEECGQKLLTITPSGQRLWKLSSFQDTFTWKNVKANILTIFPSYLIYPLKTVPVAEILQIEESHPQNWQEPLRIAIIYAADGVVDPQEMMNHRDKSDAFLQFLSDMNISLPLKTDVPYDWRGKKVYWYITTELEEEQIRRLVGNSLGVIFFHESEVPFDPARTENLGNVTQGFTVVKPWEETNYRVGFYHKMETPFPPFCPKNYLFTSNTVKDYILTKLYNSLMHSRQCPPIGWLYQKPREVQIRDILEKYLPKKAKSTFLGEGK